MDSTKDGGSLRPEACRAHIEMVEKVSRLEEKLEGFTTAFKVMADALKALNTNWTSRVPIWVLIGFTFLSSLVSVMAGAMVTFFLMGKVP